MTRHIVGVLLLVLPLAVAGEAAGQVLRAQAEPARAAMTDGQLAGTVLDEHGDPLSGVVVSAMGMTTVFAVTDDMGRFMFRGLPLGPYLVRAHLKGFAPARAREVQVTAEARAVSNFELRPHVADDEESPVLAAGFAPGAEAEESEASPEDRERAWRLRHLRRNILKDAEPGMVLAGAGDSFDDFSGDVWADVGRVVIDMPVRLATALFSDPAATAEINFLTTTSFSQPQDLFSGQAALPRGVAYVALEIPDADALWSVQGALTQGDLASWILAGSYASPVDGAHAYEIGLSYSMQRYDGGNQDALASIGDGSRNLGAVYGRDRWALARGVEVDYGARFARYDYLAAANTLVSPHAGVTLSPVPDDSLAIRVAVSRDNVAPGAAEFLPPANGLLLPPERTFSAIETDAGMVPEQVDHVEIGVSREMPGAVLIGVRAFRESVTDQIVTLFGGGQSARPAVGHYYVGSAGDLDARGVGVSVSRTLPVGLTGTMNYTVTDATWTRRGESAAALAGVSAVTGEERIHDLTTSVAGEVPATSTRVFLVYRLNTGLSAPAGDDQAPGLITRFDLRVNQALPFGFGNARWEMLVAVRNLFHDGVTDTSAFDELMVVSPPKQFVGGLTVRF